MTRTRGMLLALVLHAGCASKAEETKAKGELGGYTFTYKCTGTADAFCDNDDGFGTGKFPTLAVGSTFRVTYVGKDANGKDTPAYDVNYFAGSSRIEGRSQPSSSGGEMYVLKVLKPGYTALFANDYTVGGIGDMLHIQAAKIDHLEVSGTVSAVGGIFTGSAGGVTVGLTVAAGTVTLRAVPSLLDKTPLAGSLPVKWTQVATDVVQITSDPGDNVVKLDIKAFGVAKLHVDMGDVGADVTVTLEAKK